MTDDRTDEANHTFGRAKELPSNDNPVADDGLGTAA
jgi:hypothetical protein